MAEKEEKKLTSIERQRRWLRVIRIVLLVLGILVMLQGIYFGIAPVLGGALFVIVSLYLFCVVIVEEPERWIIERFGRFHKVFFPGWNFKLPFADTVREKIDTRKQPIELFTEQTYQLDLVDGPVIPRYPVVYVEIDPQNPERVVYRVKYWKEWVRDVFESLLPRFAQTFTVREAVDEGMILGDLLERIKEAPEIDKIKIQNLEEKIARLKREIELEASKSTLLQPLLDELEAEKQRIEAVLITHQAIYKELEKTKQEAAEAGIKIIKVMFTGQELTETVEKARQEPLIAKREAEAAIYKAIQEAIMRVKPILQAAETLREGGMPKKKALDQALILEKLGTAAEKNQWIVALEPIISQLTELVAPLVKHLVQKLQSSQGKS